jgi:hypothetical protein
MKRKIMAIWIILLLITIPFGIAQASERHKQEKNNKTISVEISTFDSDEISTTETILLSEEELVEFENTILILFDKIQSVKNWAEFKGVIEGLLKESNLGIFSIFRSLSSKLLPGKTYVISSGKGLKFNPLKKGSIKIKKIFSIWHYSSGKILKDRTLILKPLALKMRILKGLQFGFMTGFTGIYLYIARKFPQKSYTFFMGTARRAFGIQIPFGN